MSDMHIGFVGLGRMGMPMCRRLADAGYQLIAYDIDPAVRAAAASGGASPVTLVETLLDLAPATVVVTMLPTGQTVHDVIVSSRLLQHVRPGTTIVDSGSSAPAGTVELGRIASAHEVAVVDAPVSGNPARAATGSLTLMVGGQSKAIDGVDPVLRSLGRVHRVGPLGAGHAVKALNNLLSSVNLAATAEALLAGRAFGIDSSVMLAVLNESTGRNDATENKFSQYVLSGTYDSGFAIGLMAKDIRIATDLMGSLGTPAPFGAVCLELWEHARREFGDGCDNTELVRWLEQRSKVALDLAPRSAISGAA